MKRKATLKAPTPKKQRKVQKPTHPLLFWASMFVTGFSAILVLWMVAANLPLDKKRYWQLAFIIALFVVSIIAALASTEIIPWGSRSWAEWRQPKVLATFVYMILGAATVAPGVGALFNPPAAQQKTLIAVEDTVRTTDKKVDTIEDILRNRFPTSPPILHEIVGKWGDVEPDCEVIWDIQILQRGEDAAIIAQTIKTPPDVKDYRLVAQIIKAESHSLYVEGVEPDSARGASARFEFNASTQRLTWDDRRRGSGGVEVYRRCQ